MAIDNVPPKFTEGSKNFRKQYTKTWNELRGDANVKVALDTLTKYNKTHKHEEVLEAYETLRDVRDVIMTKLVRLSTIHRN